MARWHRFLLAALAAGASAAAAAKTPPAGSPLVGALEACRTITADAQRLACYDRASAALVEATAKGDVQVVDRSQLREARRSLFGFSMPKLPFFTGDRSVEDDKDELETTITWVKAVPYGRFQFGIAEGNAVWETLETPPSSFSDPRKGQPVVIKRGPLGSYFVRVNGQRGVKGKRVG